MTRYGKDSVMKRIKQTMDSSFFWALFINLVFFTMILLFCDMKYEVSDDFIVDSVLSGAYGNGYDEHLLFSNIILGYLLKAIYQLIPVVSWYFVMHIMVCFLSLTAVCYIALEQNVRWVGIIISIVFVTFFSDDVYLLIQFTKTAAIATCAGGALFLFALMDKKKRRITETICGAVMALVGVMVRFSCIYIALGFLFLIFLHNIWKYRKSEKIIQTSLITACACILLVGAAYGLFFVNKKIWNSDKDYAMYLTYNSRRASVTDVNCYGYESVEGRIEKIGIGLTDYYMIESWNFLDEDYFTEDKLKQFSNIKHEVSDERSHSVRNIVSKLWHRRYYTYPIFWGIMCLLFFMLILSPGGFFPSIFAGIATVAYLSYFVYIGRELYRLDYSVIVCMAIALMMMFSVKENVSSERKRAAAAIVLALCIAKLPLYTPDQAYKIMSDEEYAQYIYDCFYESWNYKVEKYRCNVSERQPHGNLIHMIEDDKEHYYLVDFSTAIQLFYYNYKPWLRLPQGYYNHYTYLGGVTMGYPDNYQIWEAHGIDSKNPYKSITNDGIRLIDNCNFDAKLWYIQEQYAPEAQLVLLDEVDSFKIWKVDLP